MRDNKSQQFIQKYASCCAPCNGMLAAHGGAQMPGADVLASVYCDAMCCKIQGSDGLGNA